MPHDKGKAPPMGRALVLPAPDCSQATAQGPYAELQPWLTDYPGPEDDTEGGWVALKKADLEKLAMADSRLCWPRGADLCALGRGGIEVYL